MSTCLFLIRDIREVDSLRKDLVALAASVNFGIDFNPHDTLLVEHQISLQTWDFVFMLCDSFEFPSCDLVLYPDGYPTNGWEHPLSFNERMLTIQQVAEIALQYSDEVELFLSDDNAYLPEFIDINAPCQAVAKTLCLEYDKCHGPREYPTFSSKIYIPFAIPSVHLKIHRNTDLLLKVKPKIDKI